MSGFKVELTGVADVNRVLREVGPKEGKNLMRGTTFDIAKDFAEAVKELAPVGEGPSSGALKSSIRAKRGRGSRNVVEAQVRIDEPGRSHWHFPEFGSGPDGVEQAYVLKGFQSRKGDIEQTYVDAFAKKLVKAMARKAKAG